jgi:putative selenate reductase
MLGRLAESAGRRGVRFGIQLTDALVVKNTRGRLAGEVVALSGPPLHRIAIALAHRLAGSGLGDLPVAFSAGVDAENFADTIACGFAPVTTCTDLLRPAGYQRLPRYLEALQAEMIRTGTRDVASYVQARALEREGAAGESERQGARPATAADRNLAVYAARLAQPASAASRPALPRSEQAFAPAAGAEDSRPALGFLDCDDCERCSLACPNRAVFALETPARKAVTCDLVVRDHAIVREISSFETHSQTQWVVDAGLCNACGNCDTFCPGYGGPHRVKPRLHRTRTSYAAASPEDGILIEARGDRVSARFGGVEHYLERRHGSWLFGNHAVEASLDDEGFPLEARIVTPREGHRLELAHFHELLLLVTAVLRGVNPVSAALSRD